MAGCGGVSGECRQEALPRLRGGFPLEAAALRYGGAGAALAAAASDSCPLSKTHLLDTFWLI